jgi:hypothetical protein
VTVVDSFSLSFGRKSAAELQCYLTTESFCAAGKVPLLSFLTSSRGDHQTMGTFKQGTVYLVA